MTKKRTPKRKPKNTHKYQKVTPEAPPTEMFTEVTRADSSLYYDYQLRPYNPDELYQKKGNYDLIDEMREDDQVSAAMTLKKIMIIDCGWEIECYEVGKSGNKKDFQEGNEFIEWNLRERLKSPFDRKQFEMLTGKDYGFSLTEKIFKPEETPRFGTKIVLDQLKVRPPHTFDFIQDDKANILKVKQDTASEDLYIDIDKFIHYINNPEFDNPFGNTELNKGIYRNWWSKDVIIKFWNIFLERFGMPTVVGKYRREDVAAKDEFKKVLKNIQAKTSIVMPEEFSAELLNQMKSGGGESGYERAVNYYNMMIARKMLIPDLMGFSGKEVAGGSYSLGQEHFNIFYSVVEFDRNYLSRLYTQNIVQPLLDWNYGTKYKGVFKFNPVDQDRKDKQAELWINAVKTGSIKPTQEQWNHFYAQIEYPEPSEEDLAKQAAEKEKQDKEKKDGEVISKEFPEVKGEPKAPDVTDENTPPDVKKEGKYEVGDQDKKPEHKIEKKGRFKWKADTSDKIDEKYIKEIGNTIKLIINGLTDDIRRKKIIEKKKISEVNKLQPKHLTTLQKQFESLMMDSMKFGVESAEKPKKKKFIINAGVELTDVQILDMVVNESFALTTSLSDDVLDIIKPSVFNAIKQGVGVRDAFKMIDNSMKGYNIDILDEGYKVKRIVQTTQNKFYNEARDREFSKIDDEIIGWWYSIINDIRTSDICLALDSNAAGMYRKETKVTIMPPNHPFCFLNSTLITTQKIQKRCVTRKQKWISHIKKGDLVLSGDGTFRKVTDNFKRKYDGELLNIELEKGKIIKVTPEHKIMTQYGWVKAGNLTIEHELKEVPKRIEKYDLELKKKHDYYYDLYWNKKKTFRQIEKIDRCSNMSVKFKKLGIPVRHGSEAIKTQWINNDARRKQACDTMKKTRKEKPECWIGIKQPKSSARMKIQNPMFNPECRKKAGETKKRNGSAKGKNNPAYGKLYDNYNQKHCRAGKRIDLDNVFFRSGWEANFARYLNACDYKWDYEKKTFELSNGTTYTPDFYIKNINTYIEVKGYWRDDAKLKFNLFKNEYPNINILVISQDKYKGLEKTYKNDIRNWE